MNPRIRRTLTTGPDLAAGGDAIARAEDGRVIFIRGAAPSEKVEIEIERDNPRFLRARTAAILDRSPFRVDPPCPYFGTCGGCTLQHIAAEDQTKQKERWIVEALRRIGKIDPASLEIAPAWSGAPYGYRARARFAVGPKGQVGFRALETREVVDVGACAVLEPKMQAALETVRAAGLEEGEVEAITNGDEVQIQGLGPADSADRPPLPANDGEGPLELRPDLFSQSNRAGNKAMCAHLASLLAGEAIGEAIELYAGSGNFTRILARFAKRVRAFEADPRASAAAARTAPKNVEVVCADAAEALAGAGETVDVLLVDPPRAGLDPRVLELIGRLAPRLLVYVSCDPATFARDVGRLDVHRLRLDQVRLFDLYPQTAHAELIGRLRRI